MAIGVEVGLEKLDDREQYEKAMESSMEMHDRFKEKVGHTLCREIQHLHFGKIFRMSIPEEREAFRAMGGHSRKGCPEVCGIGAKIACEIILKLRKER